VMVAPPFVPKCITPKCLAHGNEGEATPHDNSRDSSSLICWPYMMDTPSLIFRPSVMVATPPSPSALQRSSTRRRRRNHSHDNNRDSSSLIYGARSPNRLKVNPLHIWSNDIKNGLCSAGMSINSRSGKSRALDMSYFLALFMPKFTENVGMTTAKNRTYRAPEFCRSRNESTSWQNIGHSEFPYNRKGHMWLALAPHTQQLKFIQFLYINVGHFHVYF
jgi:hypothetical protein